MAQIKRADPTQLSAPTQPDLDIHRNNVLIHNTLRSLLRLSLAGAGIGAGFRGLLGLRDLLSPQAVPEPPPKRLTLEVPIKSAQTEVHPFEYPDKLSSLERWMQRQNPSKTPGGWQDPSYWKGQVDTFGKEIPQTVKDLPWAGAALGTGVAGGLYGGYKLVDWLLQSNRKAELENELEEAKNEYRTALQTQLAGRSKVAEALDRLYDATQASHVKQALLGRLPAWFLNGWIPYALATGGLAGTVTYKAMKAQQQQRLLAEAEKIRSRRGWYTQPPELEAVLTDPARVAA